MNTPTMDTQANWGEAIQREYARFLYYGQAEDWIGWQIYMPAMYDQLVEDGYMEKDAYMTAMTSVRTEFIRDLQKKLAVRTAGIDAENRSKKPDEGRIAIVKGQLSYLHSEIQKYRDGAYDARVLARAKQWMILCLFREAKKNNVEHLYKPVTDS